MKTAKLVLGIISMVLCLLVMFQSCAAGVSNTLAESGEVSGTAGLMVAFCMLAAGIVGVVTRNRSGGGAFTAGGIYLLGAIVGFASAGSYTDLNIWAGLCVAFGLAFIIGTVIERKKKAGQK